MNLRSNIYAAMEVLRALQNRKTMNWVTFVTRKCVESVQGGGKIMVCGNGGSYCDAEHFAEELSGRLYLDGVAIPAINAAIGGGHMTCVANDMGYHNVFSRGVEALGSPGDVLICLSTSGTSQNVLLAADAARKRGMLVFMLTGERPPRLPALLYTYDAPWIDTSDETGGGKVPGYLCIPSGNSARIQEAHKLILHSIAEGIEDAFRGNLVYLPGDPGR